MENPGLVVRGQAAPFSTALRSLINNPRYSDICFVVGQERQEVFAHRCLLACRCNFFQRLLGPGIPSPVVLSTVPAEAFLAVLEFLYTNSVKLHRYSVSLPSRGLGGREAEDARGAGETPFCSLNHSHSPHPDPVQVLEVLTAAVEYGLEELRELCLEFVVKVLDVELVCEALQVAVTFGLEPLQKRCIAFIETHSQEALRTRGFLELSATALLPVLRSDKLCVDEAELIQAARSWARVGAVSGVWGLDDDAEAAQAAGFCKRARGTGSRLSSIGGVGATRGRGGSSSGSRAEIGSARPSGAKRPGRTEPTGASHSGADASNQTYIHSATWGRGARTEGQGLPACMVTRFPLQVEQIVEAWKCHALRRGDAARSALCRRRRGTLPRDHHRFLDLRF
ncbi:BTB/POZ domain-containing protein 19 isoform X2 [Rattus norvegicus]|uniref:BTB/POZ domain-containing protein 19 isoform X2 n=1 Tax=Rattus norvegicus TaxID=10116 RepID=UPI0003D10029|nr:BTB/POZ domain-containing protein 19 isoform X2 [Rattus norvegicus]|eukprot:XP_008762294.1 PREDICTED: BTB/POZ domain-containing protein 19 isoform X1 [Rattus norvegicus]